MASSLFKSAGSGINLLQAAQAIKSGNAEGLTSMLAKSNPAFNQFMQECRGKSVEQIAARYGVDVETLRSVMKSLGL